MSAIGVPVMALAAIAIVHWHFVDPRRLYERMIRFYGVKPKSDTDFAMDRSGVPLMEMIAWSDGPVVATTAFFSALNVIYIVGGVKADSPILMNTIQVLKSMVQL